VQISLATILFGYGWPCVLPFLAFKTKAVQRFGWRAQHRPESWEARSCVGALVRAHLHHWRQVRKWREERAEKRAQRREKRAERREDARVRRRQTHGQPCQGSVCDPYYCYCDGEACGACCYCCLDCDCWYCCFSDVLASICVGLEDAFASIIDCGIGACAPLDDGCAALCGICDGASSSQRGGCGDCSGGDCGDCGVCCCCCCNCDGCNCDGCVCDCAC
jgi:hypothetical protein